MIKSGAAAAETSHDNKQHSVLGSLFLEGFAYDDREGAYNELCSLLKSDRKVQLLRCADWAPIELSGGMVVCWWVEEKMAYMVSPSGRVINWRKVNAGSYDKLRDCVLHTYAVTRLNERWVQGVEAKCSRI